MVTHLGNPGFKRENQDTAFCQAHGFGGHASGSLFGIFDGHGTGGMAISQHCSQLLPYFVCLALEEAYQVSLLDLVTPQACLPEIVPQQLHAA